MAQPGMDMANMMMANMMMQNMQQQGNQSVVIFLNTTNPANLFVEIIRGDKTQKAIENNDIVASPPRFQALLTSRDPTRDD